MGLYPGPAGHLHSPLGAWHLTLPIRIRRSTSFEAFGLPRWTRLPVLRGFETNLCRYTNFFTAFSLDLGLNSCLILGLCYFEIDFFVLVSFFCVRSSALRQ